MRDKIGIVVGQGQYAKWFIDNGFKHFRVNAMWACRAAEGDAYLQPLLYAIKAAGGTVLADFFAIPASLDPSQPIINRWTFPAIAILKDEMIKPMTDDLNVFLKKWRKYIDILSLATETNMPHTWRDPIEPKARGMEDYINKVVIPCKKVCKKFDLPVLAGSPTLRGENKKTFKESTHHFQVLQRKGWGNVDHLDFHAYRETSDDVINDVKRLLEIAKPENKVWISEGMGFNGKECFTTAEKFSNFFKHKFKINRGYNSEQKQLRNYKEWLQYLKTEDRIRRVYHYGDMVLGENGRWIGDSLLKADGTPSLSALHLKEALEWDGKQDK